LTLIAFLIAFVSSVCNAAATIALREASQGKAIFTQIQTPVGPLSDWYLAAITLYGASFVAFAFALKRLSPPLAYPLIVGGCYMLILAANFVLTREPLSRQSMAGGVIILAGLTLIVTAPAA
jgi:multidrug transporter EmrE-like cation transporter